MDARGGGTVCAGCAIMAILKQGFSRKKNFENPSKIDGDSGKYVNCAPIFQKLPPALLSKSKYVLHVRIEIIIEMQHI